MSGKFTGAGVGPGDPELMTLKALRVIRECSVIAVPVSDPELKEPVCSCEAARRLHQEQSPQSERDGDEAKVTGQDGHTGNGRYSRYLSGCVAYQTARKACSEIEQKDVLFLPMPMIKEKERLKEIHDLDVRAVAELLDREKDVVFLTLGDPSVYSTCMYVHRRLKRLS